MPDSYDVILYCKNSPNERIRLAPVDKLGIQCRYKYLRKVYGNISTDTFTHYNVHPVTSSTNYVHGYPMQHNRFTKFMKSVDQCIEVLRFYSASTETEL